MQLNLFFLGLFLISATSSANSIKVSGGAGNQSYQSSEIAGKFDTSEKSKFIVSADRSGSPDQLNTQFKLGMEKELNETTSFDGDFFYRNESSEDRVYGIEPTWNFTKDSLIAEDRTTTFTAGGLFSVYKVDISATGPSGKKTVTTTKSFTSFGLNAGVSQELIEGLTLGVTVSYYHYAQNPNALNGVTKNNRKIIVTASNASSMASYPTSELGGNLSWEFIEDWNFTLGATAQNSLLITTPSYSWNTSVGYELSKSFAVAANFNSSNSGSYSGGLDLTYSWGGAKKKTEAKTPVAKPGVKPAVKPITNPGDDEEE